MIHAETKLAFHFRPVRRSLPSTGAGSADSGRPGIRRGQDRYRASADPVERSVSPSTLSYTATVEASYTETLLVTPKLAFNQAATIKINDAETKAGEPAKVALSLGENKINIVVTPSSGTARTYQLTVTRKDLSKEYWSESIGKGMWRIEDFGGYIGDESFYLIEGEKRAILFDVGMGKGDLAAYVAKLTKLPVDVAITHGHRDHFGQVDQFKNSTVYIGERDVTRLPADFLTPKFKLLKGGEVIDIGAGSFDSVSATTNKRLTALRGGPAVLPGGTAA